MRSFLVDRIVNPDRTLQNCEITVDEDVVRTVEPDAPGTGRRYPIAVPGFIDIHTHGGSGHDIMDGDEDRFVHIARYHLENGTTSFLGSTTTAPLAELDRVLKSAGPAMASNALEAARGQAATLLGIHLEGPWISPERAGAQNPSYMHAPDDAAMAFVRDYADVLRMVTFSYHYPTADELLDLLLELNIIPACGHDETIDERILRGFERGLQHITHIYSMTSSFQRVGGLKHLGTLEMALMTPGVIVEVIADGKHITEHFWRFIAHNKRPQDIVVVSDSM
ncbi:MAG: amidohydrolase family protein, partial [Spirochaetaceae bacterium]|nr:amidohydrolase family protein [Spirochaetaceae bacterium]